MGYYDEIYLKRLNRYGLDYQSRIKNQREKLFENYLSKTIYRVDFKFNDEDIAGSSERNCINMQFNNSSTRFNIY